MSDPNADANQMSSAPSHAWGARRVRFWAETLIAGVAFFLAVLTLAWRDWIEEIFGVDPDNHSGALEWSIVVGLLIVAVVLALTARFEWRRLHPAAT